MAKNLVIVESPAKAKTIEKFLGKDFQVESSYGHIADLPSKELGIDVEGDFSPKYIISDDKKPVVKKLKALAKKGYIEMLAGTSRGIRLVEEMLEAEGLPLIGRVAAGEPILAQEHIEEHYKMDGNLFHPAADYLLRVNGESMKDIGILDGDLLAVHQTTEVQNGQVVVARVENDVTVKRFKREGNIVYLHAENEDFSPIKVDLTNQEFNIEGIAVGIIRSGSWM